MTGLRHGFLVSLAMVLVAVTSAVALQPTESAGGAKQPATEPGKAKSDPNAPRVVSFPTSDGGLIYADLYGRGDRGLILAHGARFTKESWKKQAPVLVRAGFRVLAIDFRGRGKSKAGPDAKRGERKQYLDILGAVRYLRGNGAKTVSVIGSSFGGEMAARAAVEAEPNEIDRLVLLSHVAIEEPEKIKCRKLFITARRDRITLLPSIRDQYDRSPQPKNLVVLEGSTHGQHIFRSKQGARLMNEILGFLAGS